MQILTAQDLTELARYRHELNRLGDQPAISLLINGKQKSLSDSTYKRITSQLEALAEAEAYMDSEDLSPAPYSQPEIRI